jgi:hypothetical protein
LRYTNIALAHIRNSPHKAIDQHYALVHEKNNITYVNIFTRKPFGKYYRISNNGINPKYNSPQYLQDQTYIVDSNLVELQKRAEADFYLELHKKTFNNVLLQLDHTKAKDLTIYVTNTILIGTP